MLSTSLEKFKLFTISTKRYDVFLMFIFNLYVLYNCLQIFFRLENNFETLSNFPDFFYRFVVDKYYESIIFDWNISSL